MYVGARMAALEEKRLMTERGGKFSFLVLVLKVSWTKETSFSIIQWIFRTQIRPCPLYIELDTFEYA